MNSGSQLDNVTLKPLDSETQLESVEIDPFAADLFNQNLVLNMKVDGDQTILIYFQPGSRMDIHKFLDAVKSRDPNRYDNSNWNFFNSTGYFVVDGVKIYCDSYKLAYSLELKSRMKWYELLSG